MYLYPLIPTSIGKHLSKSIYDDNGRVLLKKGVTLTDRYLKRLKELGYSEVYVEDALSEGVELEENLKAETSNRALLTIKKAMEFCRSGQAIDYKGIEEIASEIIDNVLNRSNTLINLSQLKRYDWYTYYHSVNVCVISLMIAKWHRYSRPKLMDLGVGALLHDVGKISVPAEVLNKRGRLNKEEWDVIKTHPTKGYEVISKIYSKDHTAAAVAIQHHERLDGSGYPNGINASDITHASRISTISDAFDALVSTRAYRSRLSPDEAVKTMRESIGTQFDRDLMNVFLKKITIYPNGSLVVLENGLIGIVLRQNPKNNYRPAIKIVADIEGNILSDQYTVDLSNSNLAVREGWDRLYFDEFIESKQGNKQATQNYLN